MVYTLIIEYLIVFNLFTNFGKMVLLPTPPLLFIIEEKRESQFQILAQLGGQGWLCVLMLLLSCSDRHTGHGDIATGLCV